MTESFFAAVLGGPARSIRQHPCWWLLGLVAVFTLFPGIDLAVSGWFYVAGEGFPWRWSPVTEFVRRTLPPILLGGLTLVTILWLAGVVLRRPRFGIRGRIVAFLLSSMAVGPGLIVNTVFKDHWGRARPASILEFGGKSLFTPPLTLSNQCDHNCSFMSGHAALGFWTIAIAFLVPARWRYRAAAVALGFGSLTGLSRIAQGGHFLSDVLYAAVVTVGMTWLLHRMILEDGEF
ncbi:MAG: phosphatase PAP2 family protein [Alphaproteobacteria bacterium]